MVWWVVVVTKGRTRSSVVALMLSSGTPTCIVVTIFLVPSPGHATSVKTSVRGTPLPTGSPWPVSAAVVGPGQHEPGLDMMVGPVVGPWFPAGNVLGVGVRQFIFDRCCTGRGGALVFCSTSSTTFNASVRRGTTGVVEDGPHEPGLAMVGAWFSAGNASRVGVGVRQFFFDRCCTGRGGSLVSCSTSSTTFNSSMRRGTTGVVVGRGINKKF